MSTAFQPDAYQGTGFQIAGGLTTSDVEITIGGSQEGDSGQIAFDIAADATGGWPIYWPRRKKKVETPISVEPEVAMAQVQEAEARLKARRELRRQEIRSREITEQIRELLDIQDGLKKQILLEKLSIQDDEEALIAILALA